MFGRSMISETLFVPARTRDAAPGRHRSVGRYTTIENLPRELGILTHSSGRRSSWRGAQMLFCRLDERCKSLGIADGDIGENLAVDFDADGLQAMNQLAVSHTIV